MIQLSLLLIGYKKDKFKMQNLQKIVVPISIIIAGGLIAAAVYFSGTAPKGSKDLGSEDGTPKQIEVSQVTSADHIKGSPSAKVVIIDYSDTECPYCKRFHETLKKIYSDYGSTGKVAWVYRHFPLDFHTKAPKEAEATECVNELGGADAFWRYLDVIYTNTPANNQLDPAKLGIFAEQVGVNKASFQKCLDSGKYTSKVSESKAAGFKAGAQGTPYTVFAVTVNGKTEYVPLVDANGRGLGALPYEALKSVIDKMLNS